MDLMEENNNTKDINFKKTDSSTSVIISTVILNITLLINSYRLKIHKLAKKKIKIHAKSKWIS